MGERIEEYFDLVNENDEIIGKVRRDECHKNRKLIHRGVEIFIFNNEGKLLLQKRSVYKDLYKGFWTSSASGHVKSGESYIQAAKKELEEELGINIPLKEISYFKVRTELESENICFFAGKSNGPFNFNKKEIEKVKFFSIDEIRKMIERGEKFTPAFLLIFRYYLGKVIKWLNSLHLES